MEQFPKAHPNLSHRWMTGVRWRNLLESFLGTCQRKWIWPLILGSAMTLVLIRVVMPTMKALFWRFSVENVLLGVKSMILVGISGGYAVYTIYLHCKKLWGGHLDEAICFSVGEVKDKEGANPKRPSKRQCVSGNEQKPIPAVHFCGRIIPKYRWNSWTPQEIKPDQTLLSNLPWSWTVLTI